MAICLCMIKVNAQKPMIGQNVATIQKYLNAYVKSVSVPMIDASSVEESGNVNLCLVSVGNQYILHYHILYAPIVDLNQCDWTMIKLPFDEAENLAKKFNNEHFIFKKIKPFAQGYSIQAAWLQYDRTITPAGEVLWCSLKWERIDYLTYKVTLNKFDDKPASTDFKLYQQATKSIFK